MNQPILPDASHPGDLQRLRNITMAVYVLQALIWPLVFTFVVAVMINYIKKDDVQGTWLESHFRWQIRTFWFSIPWFLLGAITSIVFIGWFIIGITWFWLIYRVLKGGINLYDGKPMYTATATPPV